MERRGEQFVVRSIAAVFLAGVVVAAGALPASAATKVVVITGTLSPKRLTIETGTRVTWRNDDGERHRMRSRAEGAEFDSGDLEPGETYSFRFRRPGTFEYLDERDDDDRDYWGTVTVRASSADTDAGPDAGPDAGDAVGAATVTIGDRIFTPSTVKVSKGATVTWLNRDDRDHTATGSGFDSGTITEGSRYSKRFSSSGTYTYLCAFHPDMTGSVVVGSGGPAKAAPEPPREVPIPKPKGGSRVVKIVDLAFEPAEITVEQNDTVRWINAGRAPHTVTSSAFDSGQLSAGEQYVRRFRDPGTFSYLCAIHPEMRGTVTVRGEGGSVPEARAERTNEAPTPGASASPRRLRDRAPPRPALLSDATSLGVAVIAPAGLFLLAAAAFAGPARASTRR